MKSTHGASLRGLLTSLLLSACAAGAPTPVTSPSAPPPAAAAAEPADNPQWASHLRQYIEADLAANPAAAVVQGRHEYDGRLPDWSAAALAANRARLHQARTATAAFADAELSPRQRFERDYLLARIDGDLFWIEDAELPQHNPAYYTGGGGLDPSVYLERPYAPLATRMQAFIAYLHAVPAAAQQIRANLQMPMPKSFIDLGIANFGGFADFYRHDVRKAFASVKDRRLQAQLREALPPAIAAMRGLQRWLQQHRAQGNDDYALGAERFAKMLMATERVDTPLADLQAMGRADLARNQAALHEACAQYRPGASVSACVAAMNADKPRGGAVDGARAQLDALRRFVETQALVSIPGEEQALVAEAPPYARWNFAYIDVPGPYEHGMPSTYYIAPPDPAWSKREREAYVPGQADLLFTSVHEVWPGHFLQFLHANRSPYEIGRLYVGYAYAEGWAHYSEEMMWEAGLGNGAPDVRIGQLSNALLRDVRLLCAIGLHTSQLTQAQCETMFREQAFQDPGNARQQAARGTYDPAYLNYTMGKLMIRKLREDWTASRGGRAAWRAFHDQFLSYGGPPIPLLRRQMLGAADDGRLF